MVDEWTLDTTMDLWPAAVVVHVGGGCEGVSLVLGVGGSLSVGNLEIPNYVKKSKTLSHLLTISVGCWGSVHCGGSS